MDSSSATIEPTKAIGPFDLCDSCSAKAFYMVRFVFGELFFCRHHFVKNEDALMEKAYDIYDDSDFLEE
jgi:hypothetical protein